MSNVDTDSDLTSSDDIVEVPPPPSPAPNAQIVKTKKKIADDDHLMKEHKEFLEEYMPEIYAIRKANTATAKCKDAIALENKAFEEFCEHFAGILEGGSKEYEPVRPFYLFECCWLSETQFLAR